MKKYEEILNKYLNLIEQEITKFETGFDLRNIEQETIDNNYFRKVLFTAVNLQLVVMSLNPGEEIGEEIHNDSDQFFRIDSGKGKVIIGKNKEEFEIKNGDSIIIQAGMNHNVINTSNSEKLKLYTIYAPPHHKKGTIHKTKSDQIKEEKK